MVRNLRKGFTLIELMVVIVIIGVLASLAIPRFTEASAKAKAAEAPRVIASFESAYLAGVAEVGPDSLSGADLVFDTASVNKDSKWFSYAADVDKGKPDEHKYTASTTSKLGKVETGKTLSTAYTIGEDGEADSFEHESNSENLSKLVPNFKAKVVTE